MSMLETLKNTDMVEIVHQWESMSFREKREALDFSDFSEDERDFLAWVGYRMSSCALMTVISKNNRVIRL